MEGINTPPALPSLKVANIDAILPSDIEVGVEALPSNNYNFNEQEVAEILVSTSSSHHETVTAANAAAIPQVLLTFFSIIFFCAVVSEVIIQRDYYFGCYKQK
jgi:hypothetical protein